MCVRACERVRVCECVCVRMCVCGLLTHNDGHHANSLP